LKKRPKWHHGDDIFCICALTAQSFFRKRVIFKVFCFFGFFQLFKRIRRFLDPFLEKWKKMKNKIKYKNIHTCPTNLLKKGVFFTQKYVQKTENVRA